LQQAEHEIQVAYYIFEDDGFGQVFLQELLMLKEAKPWISVNILIDASANGLSENLMYFLGTKGIGIKEYHPLPKLFMPWSHISIENFFTAVRNLNFRMHDKLLIVDQLYVLTGGRNIENSYYGMDRVNFYDRDILIRSSRIAKETSLYFNQLWHSFRVKPICPEIDYSLDWDYEREINRFEATRNYNHNHPEFLRLKNGLIDFAYNGIPITDAQFLHSYCEQEQDFIPRKLSGELNSILAQAKEELIVETPYLLYTENLLKVIRELRDRNVRVTFITNSFCSTDVSAVAGAYDRRKITLLEMGVEIYEYLGKDYLHAKSAIIDGELGFVGTYNIDPRSAYINTETIFLFKGPKAIKILRSLLESDMDSSDKVAMEKGSFSWGTQDCDKSDYDWFMYLIFQTLSKVGWIYDLL